jgi:hypothetical protein
MKFALIGAAAVAAAAFATPAMAQAVSSNPGYCVPFYQNANCQNLGRGNPYPDGEYYHNDAMAMQTVDNNNAYRYHGGPKDND